MLPCRRAKALCQHLHLSQLSLYAVCRTSVAALTWMLGLLTWAGDGKCVVCDSYVRPATLVRVCEECNYGSLAGRCTICGGVGVSDAFYCKECTVQEKDVSFLLPSACQQHAHAACMV